MLGSCDNEKFILSLTEPLIRSAQRRQIVIEGQAVTASEIDGQTPYIFNLYDSTNRLVLSQKLIGVKNNEISEAINLIKTVDLRGCILTADALNTQKKLASELINNKKCDSKKTIKGYMKQLDFCLIWSKEFKNVKSCRVQSVGKVAFTRRWTRLTGDMRK